MPSAKKNVLSVEDKTTEKGPWAFVSAKDVDGKYSASPKNVFGDAAAVLIKGGPGIYQIEMVADTYNGKKVFNWTGANKVGASSGSGVNNSQPAPKGDAATSNRVIVAVAAIKAAAVIVAATDIPQGNMDLAATTANIVAKQLFDGVEAIIKGKPLPKKEVEKAPTELPDPVGA